MPNPTYIKATLDEINGNSCGALSHRMKMVPSSSPPEYLIDGAGDFCVCPLRASRPGRWQFHMGPDHRLYWRR